MVCNPQREVIFCIGPEYRPRFFWKLWFSFHISGRVSVMPRLPAALTMLAHSSGCFVR